MANILVVDDEMGIRELLSEILGDEGHAIQLAENAQQAREARAQGAPDLVLLDIWMPDTDGVTLLKEWQRDGLLTMPVIMMSGHATIDTAVEATRIGALNFLEKPIALQKLLKAVQQGLTRAQEVVRTPVMAPRPIMATPSDDHAATPSSATAPAPMFSMPSAPMQMGARVGTIANGEPQQGYTLSFDLPLREARDAFERMYFEHHLGREGGSMTRVAEKTGLERTHLYRKLKQLGVEPGKLAKKAADGHACAVTTRVTLVTGPSPAAREQAIFGLLSAGPRVDSTAVILEGLADASSPLSPDSHLSVARIAGGCLCCAGNLVLRVTLNRLLRHQPDRVLIGVGSSDHLDQLRSWLASSPYDQLLELAPDVHG